MNYNYLLKFALNKKRETCVLMVLVLLVVSNLSADPFFKITAGDIVNDGKGSRSVNFVDVNNDNYPDIFISNGRSGGDNNMLYINNSGVSFVQVSTDPIVSDGLSSDGASFADYDNDGKIDAAVANWYGQLNLLYHGSNPGEWERILNEAPSTDPSYSEACSWADYDNDGDLDLFIANSAGVLNNYLYENKGHGNFVRLDTGAIVTEQIVSRCGLWADYDNDGDLDLFVANEGNNQNSLFENLGNGTFEKILTGDIVTDVGDSWGGSWGDYDNDGDWDLFVANNSGQANFLYENNGDKTFTKITSNGLVSDFNNSISSSWIDYDNDGDLDLFVANGFGTPQENKLYENLGGFFFNVNNSIVTSEPGWSYGSGWADYDRDGDIDLMVARWLNEQEDNTLYRNDTGSYNNYISIKCTGVISNRTAVGTVIKVKADINGAQVWQMRQVSSQDGYCSQNSFEIIFGMKDATAADSIVVIWPSGSTKILTDVPVNQFLSITEDGVRIMPSKKFGLAPLDVDFEGLTENEIIQWNWDFDDGSTSNEAMPSHQFSQPGIYDVGLTVEDNIEADYTISNYSIGVHADSVILPTVSGMGGTDVMFEIYARNYLPVDYIEIPLSWTGPVRVNLKNVTTTGLRTEFMDAQQLSYDGFNKQMAVGIKAPAGTYLDPGSGTILRLTVSIYEGATDSTNIVILPYNSYKLNFESYYGSYVPAVVDGKVIRGCCEGTRGNIDGLGDIDIGDLVYLVEYQFNIPPGPEPTCLEEADVNADLQIDIGDIVYLVEFQFGTPAGPAPLDCL